MDKLLIKTEPCEENCVICLRTDNQLLREHEVRGEILSLYKEFIIEYLENLQDMETRICFDCIEILKGILEFRSKCITAVQILSTKVYPQPVVLLEDISMKNYETIEIKPEIFTEELPTQIPTIKTPSKKTPKSEENKVPQSKKSEIVKRGPQKSSYCYICCSSFSKMNLHVHFNHTIEREKNEICCSLCLETFPKIENLYEHQKNSHFEYESPRRCGKCDDIETKSREEYINHIHKVHYPDKKRIYPCDFCPTVYLDKVFFKAHIWQHQGGLKCDQCHETFFDMEKRQRHMEYHIKKKEKQKGIQYICHFCGRTTMIKATMKLHLLSKHTTEATLRCWKCDKLFKTKKQLSDHVLKFHTEKSTICPHCGKKSSNTKTLKRHVYNKHSETKKPPKKKIQPLTRDFACDECDAKFYAKNSLQKHKYSHSKTRPYNCQMCSTGYYMNEYLRNHYLRVHGITYNAKEIRKMCGRKKPGDSDSE